jgi:hypothetical protein
MATYTSRLRTPLQADPHAHVTLAYLGEMDADKRLEVEQQLAQLPLPATLLCDQKETWATSRGSGPGSGPGHVHVRLCHVYEHAVKSESNAFFRRFGRRDPYMSAEKRTLDSIAFHLTVKTPEADAEIDAKQGRLVAHTADIKPLGPKDPVFTTRGVSHEQYCDRNWSLYMGNDFAPDTPSGRAYSASWTRCMRLAFGKAGTLHAK